MTITFGCLWQHHPYPQNPCSPNFRNQCAIRMGVALKACGERVETYPAVKCWFDHGKKHILRAQELANVLKSRLWEPEIYTRDMESSITGRTGIVFIQNFYGPGNTGDHIDVWDGRQMKGGSTAYFRDAQAIWFWPIP